MKKLKLGVLAAAVAALMVGGILGSGIFTPAFAAAEDEPKAEEPEAVEQPPAAPKTPEPEVFVLVFKEIPAESFLRTIHQLYKGDKSIEGVKIALNEPANAVVILGPKQTLIKFAQIGRQLDVPNKFHEKMRRIEMQERKMREEMQQKRAERRMEGGPRGPEAGPGHRPQMMPHGGPAMLLLSPKVREELKITDEQAEKIEAIIREHMKAGHEKMQGLMKQMQAAKSDEERKQVREKMDDMKQAMQERMQKCRKGMMAVLTPEQREKFEQMEKKMREEGLAKEHKMHERKMQEKKEPKQD